MWIVYVSDIKLFTSHYMNTVMCFDTAIQYTSLAQSICIEYNTEIKRQILTGVVIASYNEDSSNKQAKESERIAFSKSDEHLFPKKTQRKLGIQYYINSGKSSDIADRFIRTENKEQK